MDGSTRGNYSHMSMPTNERIQCSQCGTMYRSSITTPTVLHSLILFVTNMFNTLLYLNIYKWHDATIIAQRQTTM